LFQNQSLVNEFFSVIDQQEMIEAKLQGNKGEESVVHKRVFVHCEVTGGEMRVLLEEILSDDHIQHSVT
jgi:hypothetical protein